MSTHPKDLNGGEPNAEGPSETEWSYYLNSDWADERVYSGAPMVQKTYRVPVELYEAALDRAKEREENLSGVIRGALERYADGPS